MSTTRELTDAERQEIIKYCKENEDTPFILIADYFSVKFGIELTDKIINTIYTRSLMGRH